MAKKHRRRYGGYTSVSFGSLKSFNKRVSAFDVVAGAVIGLAGVGAGKWAYKQVVDQTSPTWLQSVAPAVPALSGALAGAALYYAQKGSAADRAYGHATGAVAAGVAVSAWDVMKTQIPALNGMVSLRYNGLLINDPRVAMNGIIVNDPRTALHGYADAPHMAQLAGSSMGDSDASGVEELLGIDA